MVNAGLTVTQAALDAFQGLKTKHQYTYCIFKVENNEIVPDVMQASESKDDKLDYTKFANALMSIDAPRFAVIDYEYNHKDSTLSKIIFVFWCPDSAKIKEKMIYSSSKNEFHKKLEGVYKCLQANDPGDLEESQVFQLCTGA